MTIDLHTSESLFFVPELATLGSDGILNTRESRHAGGARRLRDDDAILIFDGAGEVARARITHLDPRGRATTFSIEERSHFAEPEYRVGLACGVPKGDRQATLLDMATQAGMSDYWPVRFERSVTKADGSAERWNRIAVEACKQSRRPWLPRLHEAVGVAEIIELAQEWSVFIADATTTNPEGPASAAAASLLVIGPEGGLTVDEQEALHSASAGSINLGPHILRTETAAVAGTVRLMQRR